MFYDDDFKMIGTRIDYSLLETSRVCCMDRIENDFHVFDIILKDAPKSLLGELHLEIPHKFSVSIYIFYLYWTN